MNTKELLIELLKFKSVTPNDDGALSFIALELEDFEAFFIEKEGIKSLLLARKFNDEGEHLAFGGHIDVVPAGEGWENEPFNPVGKDGFIYARGSQDMKSGVAAFVSTVKNANLEGSRLSLLLTSDEEGEAKYGTLELLKFMEERNMFPGYAIVTEPTCVKSFSDSIKIGRCGSINGKPLIRSKQGHAAYPEKAINPIHDFAPVSGFLAGFDLGPGSTEFTPSKIVLTDIKAGLGVSNVTPNDLRLMLNVRDSNDTSVEDVRNYIEKLCHGLNYELFLTQSSKPPLTNASSKIVQRLNQSMQKISGIVPELNTKDGTNDARFFAEFGVSVAEFGVRNDMIHAVNERMNVEDFEKLCSVFKDLVENF